MDPKGNAMISRKEGGLNPVGAGYKGLDMETLYPNGHKNTLGQNHGHDHLERTEKNDSGPSIDINGNIGDFWSPDAHWTTKNRIRRVK